MRGSTARSAWRTVRQPVAIMAMAPQMAAITIGTRPLAAAATVKAKIAMALRVWCVRLSAFYMHLFGHREIDSVGDLAKFLDLSL